MKRRIFFKILTGVSAFFALPFKCASQQRIKTKPVLHELPLPPLSEVFQLGNSWYWCDFNENCTYILTINGWKNLFTHNLLQDQPIVTLNKSDTKPDDSETANYA